MADNEYLSLRDATARALRMGGSELLGNPKQLASYIADLADTGEPEAKVAQRHLDEALCAPLAEAAADPTERSLADARARMADELVASKFVDEGLAATTAAALAGGAADWLGVPLADAGPAGGAGAEGAAGVASAATTAQDDPLPQAATAEQSATATAAAAPQQGGQPTRRPRWPLVAALLAAAAAAVALFFVFGRPGGPAHYQIVASVKAPGLTGGGTRIPVRVQGKDARGNEVSQDAYLSHDGTGLSLPAGSYDVTVQGSPITADGGLYYVDNTVLSLEVPEAADPNAVLEVPADQTIALRPKPDDEVTEQDILNAQSWAEKDTQGDGHKGADVAAEVSGKARKRLQDVEAKRKAEQEKAAKEKAEREAAEKAERERAEREAAEQAERERAEREAAEQAEREKQEAINLIQGWWESAGMGGTTVAKPRSSAYVEGNTITRYSYADSQGSETIDPSRVERMHLLDSDGWYFHDLNRFLSDNQPDMLTAVMADGSGFSGGDSWHKVSGKPSYIS